MRKWLWFIVASIVFGFSLLRHLPAQLVLPEHSGRFQFIGIGGSLWRGEVEQILLGGKPLPIQDLSWTVNPLALLRGTLEGDFHERQEPDNRGTMVLSLRSRQLELRALHWRMPSSYLDSWIPLPGFGSRGDLVLDVQILQFPAHTFFPSRLAGRLEWREAELKYGPQYWHVGSPLLQFADEAEAIRGVVRNSQPVLPGDGSFECTKKSCRLDMSLRPSLDAPQFVLNGLFFLGLQQTGDGFSGQIVLPLE